MRKLLKVSIIVIILLFTISVPWIVIFTRTGYGIWDPFGIPNRVDFFGRTYYNASDNTEILDLSIKNHKYRIQQSFMDFITNKQFYMDSPKREVVPAFIFLHLNGDKYCTFTLSGGQ